MRYGMILVVAALVMVVGAGASFAQKGPLETAVEGCKKELDTYCKAVTPGEGADTRVSLCLRG